MTGHMVLETMTAPKNSTCAFWEHFVIDDPFNLSFEKEFCRGALKSYLLTMKFFEPWLSKNLNLAYMALHRLVFQDQISGFLDPN